MSLFGFPSSFDHTINSWQIYKSRIHQCFIANDITSTTDEKGIKRRAILLSALSEKTYKLALDLALPKNIQDVEFEDIIKILDVHFTPKRLGFTERYTFYTAQQNLQESNADFIARLRGLSKHCEFKDVEEALRDRFVLGLRPGPARDKLFEQKLGELTLADALDIVENIRCIQEANDTQKWRFLPFSEGTKVPTYQSPLSTGLFGTQAQTSQGTVSGETQNSVSNIFGGTQQASLAATFGGTQQSVADVGGTQKPTQNLNFGGTQQASPAATFGGTQQSVTNVGGTQKPTPNLPFGGTQQASPAATFGGAQQSVATVGGTQKPTPDLPFGGAQQSVANVGGTQKPTQNLNFGGTQQASPAGTFGGTQQSVANVGGTQKPTQNLNFGGPQQAIPAGTFGGTQQSVATVGGTQKSTPNLPFGGTQQASLAATVGETQKSCPTAFVGGTQMSGLAASSGGTKSQKLQGLFGTQTLSSQDTTQKGSATLGETQTQTSQASSIGGTQTRQAASFSFGAPTDPGLFRSVPEPQVKQSTQAEEPESEPDSS